MLQRLRCGKERSQGELQYHWLRWGNWGSRVAQKIKRSILDMIHTVVWPEFLYIKLAVVVLAQWTGQGKGYQFGIIRCREYLKPWGQEESVDGG